MLNRIMVVGLCLLWTGACAHTTGTERTGGDKGFAQTPAEARAQLDEVVAQDSRIVPDRTPPSSLADAVEILQRDEFFRFAPASDYLATQPGGDALVLRAQIECAAAEAFHTVASVVERKETRDREALALLDKQYGAGTLDDAGQQRRQQLQANADERARIVRALKILFQYHTDVADKLASQAAKEYPNLVGGQVALAEVARLRKDWNQFDIAVRKIENSEQQVLADEYLHAMEWLERFSDPQGAAERLRKLLTQAPGMVRLQADLVLISRDVEQAHQELQKLRAMSPNHLVVALLGEDIEREYEVALEIRAARAGAGAPAPAAASEPAAPAAAEEATPAP